MTGPSSQDKRTPRAFVLWDAAFALFTLVPAFLLTAHTYRGFRQGWLVLDWAIFRGVVDRLAQGQAPTTLWETFGAPVNHFSVHGHYILIPLASLARLPIIRDHLFLAYTALSYLSIAASLFLLYLLMLRHGGSRRRAWAAGSLLVVYLPVWFQGSPGFHPEVFAFLGLCGFVFWIDRGRWAPAAAFALLAAVSREEMGLVVALLGAMAMFTEPGRRKLIPAAVGPALFLFFLHALFLRGWLESPDGGFGASIIDARYKSPWTSPFLDSPATAFDDRLERLRLLLVLSAPLLPGIIHAGRRRLWLLAAVLPLLGNLASTYQFQWSDAFYYTVSYLPVLIIVFAWGISEKTKAPGLRWTLAALLLIPALGLSHGLPFLTQGAVTVPFKARKIWRVAEPELMEELHAMTNSLPASGCLAVGGLGIADHIDRATFPLEGVVKNNIPCELILLRAEGENYDPRWGVDISTMAGFLRSRYKPVVRRKHLILFARKELP